MDRKILFRGQRVDKKEFVFGDLIHGVGEKFGKMYILPIAQTLPSDCHHLDGYEVVPKTVGQLWYVTDKIECFDGDLFEANTQVPFERKYTKRIVLIDSFGRGVRYWILINGIKHAPKSVDWTTAKLIGNIHDNLELLNQ